MDPTRASIIAYLQKHADRKERAGQVTTATEIRAVASAIKAELDNPEKVTRRERVGTLIWDVVAERFPGVSRREILGRDMGGTIVRARITAIWAARQLIPEMSRRELASYFGDRDVTTIDNAIERADEWRADDEDFRLMTDTLVEKHRLLAGEVSPIG